MPARSEAYLARTSRHQWAGLDWRALGVVVLLSAFIWGGYSIARPVYQHWRQMRAQHLAQSSLVQLESGDYQRSQETAMRAYSLGSTDPATLRLLAQRASRISPEESLQLRQRILQIRGAASTDDARAAIRLASQMNRHDIAMPLLDQLLLLEPTLLENLILASEVSLARGDLEGAIVYARRASDLQPQNEETQFLLARMLYQSPEHRQEARDTMLQVSKGISGRSLQALVGLANDESLSAADRQLVLKRLRRHPKADWPHEVLTWVLQLKNLPEDARRAYLEDKLEAMGPKDNQLPLIARWLNALGYADLTLQWLPEATARKDSNLFLLRLDALAKQRRYRELGAALDRRDIPLSETQRAFYRARLANHLKDPQTELLWSQMLSAARQNPATQYLLAQQLEAIGQPDLALTVYRMMAKRPETARYGFYRILRYYQLRRSTNGMRRTLEQMANAFPEDPDLLQQSLYARLLMGFSDEQTLRDSEELVRRYPERMAYRVTLALAYLRAGRPRDAMQTIVNKSVNFDLLQPGWQAVYVAILKSNNLDKKSQNLLNKIKLQQLLPEENELLNLSFPSF